MTTIIKKLRTTATNRKPVSGHQAKIITMTTGGQYQNIPCDQIDLSPRNYRKYFSQVALAELAQDIALHGVINSLTVRMIPSGRYQLVAGERRLRAAHIAGLASVPVVIRELTDQQVTEIQLSENLQREDPHPLDESNGIALMQSDGMGIEEISLRLGKSKSFIYNRIRLSQLNDDLKEVFFAGKISVSEATEIAGLSAQSQQDFYDRYCQNWQDKNFHLRNFKEIIATFSYDLNKAPFDITDQTLIPQAGACGNCPFNSATLKSLFPEMEKQATCSNGACYKEKCTIKAQNHLRALVNEFCPDALIIHGYLSDKNEGIIANMVETVNLPQLGFNEVTLITAPVAPDKDDYTDLWEDAEPEEENEQWEEDQEEEEAEKQERKAIFDQHGYDLALQEYHSDLDRYNQRLTAEGTFKALYFYFNEIRPIYYTLEKTVSSHRETKVTAKQVQEAIKAGTATPELLQNEIARIHSRELRAKQLDMEKVQQKIQTQFSEGLLPLTTADHCTTADQTAVRLLVYQSLSYSVRAAVETLLFTDENIHHISDTTPIYNQLAALTEKQFCYMVRMAIASKPESKLPHNISGIAFYHLAEQAGFDVQAIEKDQARTAKQRAKKLKPRIKDLEQRIKRLTSVSTQQQQA